MTIGVVVFPGSNCDRDVERALSQQAGAETRFVWHKENSLDGIDAIVLPGGFSYGDYLRAGAIARFSPIMAAVREFASSGGPVLGICNGFQILVESSLLPGTLMRNRDLRFVCRDVYICSQPDNHAGLSLDPTRAFRVPIAHQEGNYYLDDDHYQRLLGEGQVVFAYCDTAGKSGTKTNPNGSVHDVAGVCSANGRILGMMPHPERSSDAVLGKPDGLDILHAWINTI